MRTLTYFFATALLLTFTACGGDDKLESGTSSGTLLVQATVSSSNMLDNTQDPTQFSTHYSVHIEKQGTPVVTAVVTLKVGSTPIPLMNQASTSPGDYTYDANGLPSGNVYLDVDAGPDFLHGAMLASPGLHWFAAPLPGSIYPANTPLMVTWNRPAPANQSPGLRVASFEGNVADSGSSLVDGHYLGAQTDARCRLTRSNKVALSGAANSYLEIDVKQSLTFTLQ